MRGWALAEQGQAEEGIAQMRQGLAAYRATGAECSGRLSCHAGRGVWESRTGRRRTNVLAEALALVEKTGERFYEAELYRLKGTLTLQKVRRREAEAVPSPQPLSPVPSGRGSRRVFPESHRDRSKQQAKSWNCARQRALHACGSSKARQHEAHKLLVRNLQLVHRRV